MSKGSKQRPYDKEKFDENWDRIFANKPLTEKTLEDTLVYLYSNQDKYLKQERVENAKQSGIQKGLQAGSEVSRNT